MEVNKDTKKPLISVIVPIYNTEKYLLKCLNSIKNQYYINFEVLLINDGSTDNSLDICLKFAREDERFSIQDITNKGVSNARNLGILKSKGSYLVFIDSDDWVDSNYLQDFVNNIPEDEEFIIIQNAYDELDGCRTLKFNFESSHYKLDEEFFHLFYDKVDFEYGYLWNKFFIKSIIINNNLKFDINKKLFEDEEFYYNYLKLIKNVYTISNSNYYYVSRINSAIKKQWNISNYLTKFDLRYELFTFFTKNKVLTLSELRLLCSKYFNKQIYSIYKEHIYEKSDIERLNNMKLIQPFLRKYCKYFNLNNKRIKLVLDLVSIKQYVLANLIIKKFL